MADTDEVLFNLQAIVVSIACVTLALLNVLQILHFYRLPHSAHRAAGGHKLGLFLRSYAVWICLSLLLTTSMQLAVGPSYRNRLGPRCVYECGMVACAVLAQAGYGAFLGIMLEGAFNTVHLNMTDAQRFLTRQGPKLTAAFNAFVVVPAFIMRFITDRDKFTVFPFMSFALTIALSEVLKYVLTFKLLRGVARLERQAGVAVHGAGLCSRMHKMWLANAGTSACGLVFIYFNVMYVIGNLQTDGAFLNEPG